MENICSLWIFFLIVGFIIFIVVKWHLEMLKEKYKYILLAEYMSELTETNIIKRQSLIENFAINLKLRKYEEVSKITLRNEFEEYLKLLEKKFPSHNNGKDKPDYSKIVAELQETISKVIPELKIKLDEVTAEGP